VARSWTRAWPLAAVVAASIVFRLPPILHASQTNADAAVVGLQAMHLLRGEWSWFLWGSGYQTSVDSIVAAALFSVLGPTPRALLFAPLGLHLVLMCLSWAVLARRIDPVRAALAVLPLVFTSAPLQTYILYPPRQAALTLAVAALFVFDRAADGRRPLLFALAGAVLGLACFADPYALVLVPPIGAFGLACAIRRDDAPGSRRALLGAAAGASLGAVPFFLLRASARATGGQLTLDGGVIARNARELLVPCLRWTLGGAAWSASSAMHYEPWDGPLLAQTVIVAGGTLFFVALCAGGACVFARRLPWSVRRLAVAGGLAVPVTIGGYLVSPMVMDVFSSRYLVAIVVLAPFAIAPLAFALDARRLALLLVLPAAACALSGWLGYGPFLRAPVGGPTDEERLAGVLEAHGVRTAVADYWTAYRVTFLTRERLLVVPPTASEDRYAPYRAAFDGANVVAYVFDPERSREAPDWIAGRLGPAMSHAETIRAGRLTAVVFDRSAW
jgi:hypothetical protein